MSVSVYNETVIEFKKKKKISLPKVILCLKWRKQSKNALWQRNRRRVAH